MDVVICSCANCGAHVGDFENYWDQIGKRHFSPVGSKTKDSHITLLHSGDVRIAPVETVIEDSYLQDLSCAGCEEILGLRCHNAPPGHILRKGQIILHLNKMTVISGRTGKPCTPAIRHSYALKGNATKSGYDDNIQESPNDVKNSAGADNDHPSQLDDSHRLQQLTQFAEWAEGAIGSQKRDIDRISATVNKIETDMRSFKDFMAMVRRELTARPTNIEIDNALASVHSLRDEIGQYGPRNGAGPAEGPLSFEDVELITQSITTMNQKVNEIDSLKLEIQFLKMRLKRSEESAKEASRFASSRPSTPLPTTPSHRYESVAKIRPLKDQLQRNATEIERLVPNSTASDDSRIKRRRVSGSELPNQMVSNLQSSSTLRKPSRLSNVFLPDTSPDRSVADTHELSGMSSVDDIMGNTPEPPKPPSMHLAASPETAARSSSPLAEGQSWSSIPSRRHTAVSTSAQVQGSKHARRARGGSDELDPDYVPGTSKVTKSQRLKTGAQGGRRRNSINPSSKNASGTLQEKGDELENNSEGNIVQSVERDDEPATPRTAKLYLVQQQIITDEEQQRIRQEALEARERLVKDTIDKELSMAI